MNGNECAENLAESKPVVNNESNEVFTNICSFNEKLEVLEKIVENGSTSDDVAKCVEHVSDVLDSCSTSFIHQEENTISQIVGIVDEKINGVDDTQLPSENHVTKVQDDNHMEVDGESEQQVTEELSQGSVEIPSVNHESTQNDLQEVPANDTVDSLGSDRIIYEWTKAKLFCTAIKEFKPTETCENFTKGCLWSPDGTCIMVPSDDCKIRIFDLPKELYYGPPAKDFKLPNYESAVHVREGGIIYDCCWFPYMNSYDDPTTCCFLSTSQGSPIHLWDAFTGKLKATYRAYNLVDEVEAAISVRFTNTGGQIWSGFKNALRSFDANRPGRQQNTIFLKKDFPNVSGLVSCIREHPFMPGLIAFGTYSKCIGLYKDGPLCSFKTANGVTQIEFSPCGNKLYSTVRRGSEFLCWDLRNPGTVLYSLENRQSDTNQRIQFDISYNGEEVISGGTDGAVRVWRISREMQLDEDLDPVYKIQISKDSVNGVNLHKNLPLMAVSTGSRICDEEQIINRDNSLRFYWLKDR